jgi:hypothetical protein
MLKAFTQLKIIPLYVDMRADYEYNISFLLNPHVVFMLTRKSYEVVSFDSETHYQMKQIVSCL